MKSSNSRRKMIMEGVRPRLSTIIDGRTCSIVRGLFPYLILLVQNAVSSKWPFHDGEVLISFSIFWQTPVSNQEEIAIWKSRWNSRRYFRVLFTNSLHPYYLACRGLDFGITKAFCIMYIFSLLAYFWPNIPLSPAILLLRTTYFNSTTLRWNKIMMI